MSYAKYTTGAWSRQMLPGGREFANLKIFICKVAFGKEREMRCRGGGEGDPVYNKTRYTRGFS